MKMKKMTSPAMALALLALLLAPHAYVSAAQSQTAAGDAAKGDAEVAAPTPQRGQLAETPWEVKCATPAKATEAVCEMSKQVVVAKSRQLITRVSLASGKDDSFVLRVLLPHGLSLADGVALSVDDGEPRKLAFTTSIGAGVIARMAADAEIMSAMKAGNTLKIQAKSRAEKDLSLTVSLKGFGSSLQKLQ
jgi:invasion protein IalB